MEGKIQMSLILTNIKKHVACSYGYKLLCADDKFSKPFKSYLGEYAVYDVIDTMIEEIKYCSEEIKKHFNKKLAMTVKTVKSTVTILRTLLNVGSVIMIIFIIMLK